MLVFEKNLITLLFMSRGLRRFFEVFEGTVDFNLLSFPSPPDPVFPAASGCR